MIRVIVTAVLLPGVAFADDFCTDLTSLARDGTPVIDAKCTRSLGLGGVVSHTCAWGFDYRSEDATEAFEDLLQDVSACAAELALDEPSVSHPDSYDLRQFEMPEAIISVSLKDKAALSETYVFLRTEARNPS